MNRIFLCGLAALLCSCTGSETINCVEMPGERACQEACQMDPTLVYCSGNDGGTDAGDTGTPDAGPDVPTSNCTTECTGETPICNEDEDEDNAICVQCLLPVDCDGVEGRPMCDMNRCVECTSSTQCDTAEASLCGDDGLCGECAVNADCDGVMDGDGNPLNVCDTSGDANVCVGCTEATAEEDCDTFSCNPATQLCTETVRGDVPDCGGCVGDAECNVDGGFRCVPMEFAGEARDGGYCLKLQSEGCESPYRPSTITAESLSGEAETVYCAVDQAQTTCEAIRALRVGSECPTMAATECAAQGARCEDVGGTLTCTYSCGSAIQCPSGFTCDGDYCGS